MLVRNSNLSSVDLAVSLHRILNMAITGLATQNITLVRNIYSNLPLLARNDYLTYKRIITTNVLHLLSRGFTDLINKNYRCARLESTRLSLIINRLN